MTITLDRALDQYMQSNIMVEHKGVIFCAAMPIIDAMKPSWRKEAYNLDLEPAFHVLMMYRQIPNNQAMHA